MTIAHRSWADLSRAIAYWASAATRWVGPHRISCRGAVALLASAPSSRARTIARSLRPLMRFGGRGATSSSSSLASSAGRRERELGDPALRQCMIESRATIYASEHEGFGLPPVESLSLGIPTIVSARLPAVAELPELGQVRLAAVTPQSIAEAVRLLCDDELAARKTAEIAELRLPGWADIARGLHCVMTETV